MASKVEVKSIDDLQKMHTGTLMNRRAALLKCEETFEMSDRNGYETMPLASDTGIIEFKDSPEWRQAYKDLKGILANRDNIPNKQERKALRQAKASK